MKEKDIVNFIVHNWDKYFTDIRFCKTEYSLRDFRVDLLADMKVNLKDLGIRDYNYIVKRAPIFFEFKFNSEMRDLLFEIQKQINFRNWYINIAHAYCIICVISDRFDESMTKFLKENNVYMIKITIDDNDLNTLKLSNYCQEIDDGYIKNLFINEG